MAVSGHRRTGGRREQSRERENAMVVVGVGKTVPVVVDGAAGRRWVVCRQTPAASGEANRGGDRAENRGRGGGMRKEERKGGLGF